MRLCIGLLFAWLAGANGVRCSAQERAQSELGLLQRQLQQSRTEMDRLIDLRVRHDVGLPAEDRDERTFRTAVPASTEALERMQSELRDESAAASLLNDQYEKLRAAVDQVKAAAQARLKIEAGDRPLVTIPLAGVAAAGAGAEGPPSPNALAVANGTEQGATAGHGLALPAQLDPIVTQIHGSTDHQRVAQALFRAGQELMRVAAVARAQGQQKTAHDLDERGRDKLVRAVAELAPLLADKQPPYAALFYLGRCREQLFRYSELHEQLTPAGSTRDYARREQEVREPFLAITARDVVKTGPRSDVDVLGDWGRAAQAAMTNFSWINQHAGYDAMTAIHALTWPGER